MAPCFYLPRVSSALINAGGFIGNYQNNKSAFQLDKLHSSALFRHAIHTPDFVVLRASRIVSC